MLRRPIKYQPGTHFRYDGIGSDLLSAVLSKAIRRNSETFARQRLFGPLQIENYKWSVDTEGYLHGESGLWLTARDMAKIGLLYLRRGQWQGKQIVSEAFVQDSTSSIMMAGRRRTPPTATSGGSARRRPISMRSLPQAVGAS
jgi:CubicO group peptidase (beta-lactamase class C family)